MTNHWRELNRDVEKQIWLENIVSGCSPNRAAVVMVANFHAVGIHTFSHIESQMNSVLCVMYTIIFSLTLVMTLALGMLTFCMFPPSTPCAVGSVCPPGRRREPQRGHHEGSNERCSWMVPEAFPALIICDSLKIMIIIYGAEAFQEKKKK